MSSPLDRLFAALADPTRRALLERLATGEATVMELAGPFRLSQPAISKHLKVLEAAGLITRGRDAQRRPARLEPAALEAAAAWIAKLEHPAGSRPKGGPASPGTRGRTGPPGRLSRPWRRL